MSKRFHRDVIRFEARGAHRAHHEWSPSRLVRWGQTVGPKTATLVEAILSDRPHPEQGYRSCLGILRLERRYGRERLEAACARALGAGARSYRHACHPRDRFGSTTAVELVCVPQRFGGRRWFFRCPELGLLVPSLYLPPGDERFASREAHGLRYEIQRHSIRRRCIEQRAKLERRLGGSRSSGWLGPPPERPSEMHRRTYARLAARWHELSARAVRSTAIPGDQRLHTE